MRLTPHFASLVAGMLAGVVLVLSCGDDSPNRADAASCDCPASEPPISGRIMNVDATQVIAPNSRSGQGAACPQGAVLLSGSCTTEAANPVRDVTLEQSGFYEADTANGWNCWFKNNENMPVTIKATARCLVPAQ